jgi:hypothetical protein
MAFAIKTRQEFLVLKTLSYDTVAIRLSLLSVESRLFENTITILFDESRVSSRGVLTNPYVF